jgi:hypothetical protein
MPPAIAPSRTLIESLRTYGSGRLSTPVMLRLMCPLIVGSFVLAVALAAWSYPRPFDIRLQWISSLASAKQNPAGFFYMGSGLTAVALLLIPVPGYLGRGEHASPAARRAGATLLWIGIAALLLLGVETTAFPNYGRGRSIHRMLSVVTLTTLTLGFASLTISRSLAAPRRWLRAWLACGVLLAPAVGVGVSGVLLHLGPDAPGWAIARQDKRAAPFYRTLAFWEWAAVIGLFAGGSLCVWAVSPDRVTHPLADTAAPRAVDGARGPSPTPG